MTSGGDRRTRWIATAVAVVAGLGLASVHWLGLVAGATLVALPQRTWARGVAAGIAFGLLALTATAVSLSLAGGLDTALTMTQPLGVAVGVAVVGGAVGGLVRGVVG
ncbi:hypothetical protein [Halobaculum rubrum]|uniref:hypothetical protein n=1 Tax=Halobaculum rubrum TaxID=2872158 RepID=UPI001CA395F8|nr:hypothetical protein [Halobaculum rubrum]QZY00338.1 hypothetical protein K6T25_04365 [Halobaculum rubrum]